MKKVININFHGRVVPIEETAYDVLKQYVESLRRFFANEEGRDEIINDIEDRIAELFAETLKKGSTCITDDDVNTIIASMGRPEEFEAEEASVKSQLASEGAQGSEHYHSAAAEVPRGRLYRDEADKILGGVCGGIANYFRIDASLVRILFAIITFGGFGAGILLYFLMWIILPSRALERNVIRKRLFRNPEDKVVGGVASGLAAYFNMAVWIPRLIFALPLVIGIFTSIMRNAFWHFDPFPSIVFGSFGGTLFIVYIILWAVIPEARSASEKLEMKGEKVDLNTIKTTIQEDLSGFKARAEKWGRDAGEKAGQWGKEFGDTVGQHTSRMTTEFGTAGKRGGSRILNILGVLIKAFFLVIAGVLSFILLMAIIVGSIKGYDFIPLKDYLLEGDMQYFLVWPAILLFVFLPVIGLITWLIRRLMKVPPGKHRLGWIFGGLWIIGLICAIGLGTGIGSNFSRQVSEKFPVNLAQPSAQTLTVKLGAEPGKYYPYNVFDDDHDNDMLMLTKDEDSMLLKKVTIEIAKSDDSLFHAYVIKLSRGRSLNQAEETMQSISFTTEQADSVLTLQKGFAISKQSKFRDQGVAIVIEVPVGKKIFLDESVEWYDWFNLDFDNGRYSRNTAYDKRTYSIGVGKSYTMTTSGLERSDKEAQRREEGYGFDAPAQKSKEELKKEIEEQQKELERKKKELQKADSTYKYKPAAATDDARDDAGDKGVTTIHQPQAQKDIKAANHFIIGDIMMMRFGS
jgi:phage shock protein PspC (stress-responsive transcriptional regulator)